MARGVSGAHSSQTLGKRLMPVTTFSVQTESLGPLPTGAGPAYEDRRASRRPTSLLHNVRPRQKVKAIRSRLKHAIAIDVELLRRLRPATSTADFSWIGMANGARNNFLSLLQSSSLPKYRLGGSCMEKQDGRPHRPSDAFSFRRRHTLL